MAAKIRSHEEQSSRTRMGSLEEIDQVRIMAEAEATRTAAERDRRLFRRVFVSSGVFLILIVLLVLLLGQP